MSLQSGTWVSNGCPMSLQSGTWVSNGCPMSLRSGTCWGHGDMGIKRVPHVPAVSTGTWVSNGCPMSLQLGTWVSREARPSTNHSRTLNSTTPRVPHVPAVGDMGIARSATFHEPFTYAQLNNTAGCPMSLQSGTWASREARPSTNHSQRLNLNNTPHPSLVIPKTRPRPFLGLRNQLPSHRIPVHIP
jgi:hypothetical protein